MYEIIYTKTFLEAIKRHKKDKKLMEILHKKTSGLMENPRGKFLKGTLSNYKSIRIGGSCRLIFSVDEKEKKVFLVPPQLNHAT